MKRVKKSGGFLVFPKKDGGEIHLVVSELRYLSGYLGDTIINMFMSEQSGGDAIRDLPRDLNLVQEAFDAITGTENDFTNSVIFDESSGFLYLCSKNGRVYSPRTVTMRPRKMETVLHLPSVILYDSGVRQTETYIDFNGYTGLHLGRISTDDHTTFVQYLHNLK